VPPTFPLFHLIRAYQIWDTCVLCGDCEQTCPAGIPLKTLQDMVRYFSPEEVFDLVPGLEKDAQNAIMDVVNATVKIMEDENAL
jgi:L-lactate utilization protein LutB